MYRPSFIPRNNADLDIFLRNFVGKLPQHAAVLNISAAEIAALTADSAMLTYFLTQLKWFEAEWEKRREYGKTFIDGELGAIMGAFPGISTPPAAPAAVPAGLIRRLVNMIIKIMHTASYNEYIGRDFGIVVATKTKTTSKADSKPILRITLEGGRPVIKWVKGSMDGVDLYVDRNDGKGFVMLYGCNGAKYKDMSVLPDVITTWTYKAVYKIGVEQVGSFSEASSIAVINILRNESRTL